jgi:hypothetical protein
MSADQLHQVLVWSGLAFCLWLALDAVMRRLPVPNPVFVAATLSWIVARVFIWAIPLVLHEMRLWTIQ